MHSTRGACVESWKGTSPSAASTAPDETSRLPWQRVHWVQMHGGSPLALWEKRTDLLQICASFVDMSMGEITSHIAEGAMMISTGQGV